MNASRAAAASALALLLLTAACAAPFERPAPVGLGPLRARAVTKVADGVRVSAAVASADESRAIFGIDLKQRDVQPLWLEVENGSEHRFHLLRTGLDPEYFAPLEVAFLYEGSFDDQGDATLGEHLEALSFDSRSLILPGETESGFVFINGTNPSMVDVDLVGQEWSRRISLVVPVPGTEEVQRRFAALGGLYAAADLADLQDEAALRTALETLPCCTVDETGTASLPLNLVLIGALDQWGPAFVRRNYRYRPVSPWVALGREQDVSGRKISRWVAPQPHTLRIWLTPLRYRGQPVWLGQVSTVLGGRFAAEGTRRFDPEVDEARNDVVQDLFYSQALAKVGFVEGAGGTSAAEARPSPAGSPYRTDGLRTVLMFAEDTVSLAEIDFFDWERLADYHRQILSQ